mmetsp:Transcript_1905/g.7644  ORF Transcript_1905/g.7644 Transcript_1905/m.7644 type:complete len:285 (-) Transcript_1905:1543-2397(-)
MSAPASSRTVTHSMCPFLAATCSGVSPLRSALSLSAPASSSIFRHSVHPWSTATSAGVSPSSPSMSRSAPASSSVRRQSACPLRAAMCAGEENSTPSGPRNPLSGSAPASSSNRTQSALPIDAAPSNAVNLPPSGEATLSSLSAPARSSRLSLRASPPLTAFQTSPERTRVPGMATPKRQAREGKEKLGRAEDRWALDRTHARSRLACAEWRRRGCAHTTRLPPCPALPCASPSLASPFAALVSAPPSAAPVDSFSTFATSGSSVACTPGVKKTPADSSEDRKL